MAIPNQDLPLLQWMRDFDQNIRSDPPRYQLASSDANAIHAAVDLYDQKYQVSANALTRTPVAIDEKDAARNSAEQICRQYAILIKYNGGISDADKTAIGVDPVNPDRDPVECPQTSPALVVVAATPGAHNVRYVDSLTPDKRAKPFGATELQLFVHIGETSVSDPELAKFVGKFTKNPVVVSFDASDNGKQATYFARWASRRGETGPWSLPESMAIAA